jgi:hypothetical protein
VKGYSEANRSVKKKSFPHRAKQSFSRPDKKNPPIGATSGCDDIAAPAIYRINGIQYLNACIIYFACARLVQRVLGRAGHRAPRLFRMLGVNQ